MSRAHTEEQVDFVRDNIAGRSYAELAELFNARFGTAYSRMQIQGIARHHDLYSGFYTINPVSMEQIKNGYIQVRTGSRRWRNKHTLVWEAANGPVPKGHKVIFADGNKRNFDLGNLVLVSHRELAAMMAYKYYSPDAELTKQGLALARLKMLINKRKRDLKGGKAK
jgi:hypothetical protein